MRKFRIFITKNDRAQSMVEFALVLPILLTVIYGMLEVGRLVFMHTIIATASREAARYGSATGLNVVGAGSKPRYKDCDGIKAAAQNVDFLDVISDTNITIQFDHGPGTAVFANCPPASVQNGDRILVQVTATFVPIVPLVPLDPIAINSANARTILVNVAVGGSALPPPTVIPPPPTHTFTPTTAPTATRTQTPTASSTPATTNSPTATNANTATVTKVPTNTSIPSSLTPTNTSSPTTQATATNTLTPVPSPTPTATRVDCTKVTHSGLTTPFNNLRMHVYNDTGTPLTITQIFVQWNNDDGHIFSGGSTALRLRSIVVAGVTIWTGDAPGPSLTLAFVPEAGITLNMFLNHVDFIFNQSYDNLDGSERIMIQFANNGCSSYTLDSSSPVPTP